MNGNYASAGLSGVSNLTVQNYTQHLDGQWSLIFPRAYATDRYAFKIQWSTDLLDWHTSGVVFSEPIYDDMHIVEKVTIEAATSRNLFVRFLEN